MKEDKFTLIINKGNIKYKICKILFGNDGSYFVTVPYHKEKKAFLTKFKKGFKNKQEFDNTNNFPISLKTETVNIGYTDNKILKLSHHPDGFVQFSGNGVVSGKTKKGEIKGIGLQSWPLEKPAPGPSFAVSIQGVEDFETATSTSDTEVIFNENDFVGTEATNGYVIEGFYFPKRARRFIDENKMISFIHPSGFVLRLKTLLPIQKIKIQGFIALHFYKTKLQFNHSPSAFALSGSSQFIIKKDGAFEVIGIHCMFPRSTKTDNERSLDFIGENLKVNPLPIEPFPEK